jgi:WD repeat-containing protein 45
LKKSRVLGESGVALIEMTETTNYFALVFTNQRNKLVIWDDNRMLNCGELIFDDGQEIKNIKLSKDLLIVIMENKVHVFDFKTFRHIDQFSTCVNPFGLCSISMPEKKSRKLIVCLHQDQGSLKTLKYFDDKRVQNKI